MQLHYGNALGFLKRIYRFSPIFAISFFYSISAVFPQKKQYCALVVSRSTQQHLSFCLFEKALIPHIKSLRRKKLAPLMEETTKVMISCQKDAPPLNYPLKARISSKRLPLPFILQLAEQLHNGWRERANSLHPPPRGVQLIVG